MTSESETLDDGTRECHHVIVPPIAWRVPGVMIVTGGNFCIDGAELLRLIFTYSSYRDRDRYRDRERPRDFNRDRRPYDDGRSGRGGGHRDSYGGRDRRPRDDGGRDRYSRR